MKAVAEQFLRSVLSGDKSALRQCVDPDYQSDHRDASGDFEALFRSVSVLRGIDRILTEPALLEISSGAASFGPVVFYPKISIEPSGATVRLSKTGDGWLVVQLEEAPVPKGFLYPLSDSFEVFDVEFAVRDVGSLGPVACRVNIVDREGEYWPPLGHMKHFPTGHNEDVGGDVLIGGSRFAYVESSFVAPLPAGAYTARFVRGPEYREASVGFLVPHTEEAIVVDLSRWVDMNQRGWYSGDTHVHFLSPQAALLEARGEDLNVVNVLATQWSDYYTNVEHFTGELNRVSDERHLVYVNQESRHPTHGHTSLLALSRLVRPLAWGQRRHGYNEGTWGGHDYPAMAKVADQTHHQGGFVAWAHMDDGIMDGELAIDVALGKLDGIELFHFIDPFVESTWDGETRRPTTELWYRFLNCGFRLPALAGTDKMFNRQLVGGVRVYVKIDGELSYGAWIESARAGRTFVTTGPMLDLVVGDAGIGEKVDRAAGGRVKVRASVESATALDALEIVRGGEIVASVSNPDLGKPVTLEVDIEVPTSTWVAARAHGPVEHRVQELPEFDAPGIAAAAHTSPVWIVVDEAPVRSADDARDLAELAHGHITWTVDNGRFLTDDDRAEVLGTFEAGLEVLRNMARGV